METRESMEQLSRQVKAALDGADLTAFSDLLHPNVRWGPPGDTSPPCQSRAQVLAWYQRGKDAGASATVTNVTVLGDELLVGLVVRDTKPSRQRGGQANRWQLLSIRDGQVTDIVGFERQEDAEAYARASS